MESSRRVPLVSSFLMTVSHYQVNLQHLAGKANLPSDFSSCNVPDCNEPTGKSAPLYLTWKTPLYGTSQSRISLTTSPTFHSPQDLPGYRFNMNVLTSREFTPILNKALVCQRNSPIFAMSIIILTVLPLLKTEFSWLNAVSHLFQLLKPLLYPGPCWIVS